MIDIIKNNATALAAAQAGNWAACVAALAVDTVQAEDHELRSTRWLMTELTDQAAGQPAGTTEADVVLATLQASTYPRVQAAYAAMSAGGIDLADQQVQQMVPVLAQAGNWPDGLAAKVLGAGVQTVSRWKQATGTEPTEQAVQALWEAGQVNTFDRHALQISVNRRGNGKLSLNAILRQVGTTAGGADVEGSKSVLAIADASVSRDDPREQAFVDAITAAVEAYIAGAD